MIEAVIIESILPDGRSQIHTYYGHKEICKAVNKYKVCTAFLQINYCFGIVHDQYRVAEEYSLEHEGNDLSVYSVTLYLMTRGFAHTVEEIIINDCKCLRYSSNKMLCNCVPNTSKLKFLITSASMANAVDLAKIQRDWMSIYYSKEYLDQFNTDNIIEKCKLNNADNSVNRIVW